MPMRRYDLAQLETLNKYSCSSVCLQGLPENYAPLLVENIKKGEYTHIVAGHSAFGKSLLPRVAALLDVQQISDITGIESEDSAHLNVFSSWGF